MLGRMVEIKDMLGNHQIIRADGRKVDELRRSRIHTTRKGDLGDVEFILQQVVDNLDHPLDRQRLLRDYQTAIGIGRGQLRLEGRALL